MFHYLTVAPIYHSMKLGRSGMVRSGKIFYGATSPSVLVGLGFLWAWWDLAFYLGIFYSWSSKAEGWSIPSFLVGMAVCGVVLLVFAKHSRKAASWLEKKGVLFASAVIPIISSGCCIVGAWADIALLVLFGSAANGAILAVLISLWFCMAGERGSASAIISMALGIAGGIALDAVILFALRPLAAAFASGLFPCASILVFRFAALTRVDEYSFFERPAINARIVGHGLKDEFFGLSVALLVGIVIAEVGFNFMNYRFSFASPESAANPLFSYSFLVARGIGALACFISIGIFRVPPQRFFWVGTMLMSAAFALMPFFEAVGVSPLVCNYVNMACFALVAIFEIAVFCEVAAARKVNPIGPVCFGMVFLTGITDLGMGLGCVLDILGLGVATYSAITTAVGYIVVFGLFATVTAGQRYLDPDSGAASGRRIQTEDQRKAEAEYRRHYEHLVEQARLSGREQEVLGYVLRGSTMRFTAINMGLSENTVKTHVQSIYKKLGIHGRQEACTLFALKDDLLSNSSYGSFTNGQSGEAPFDENPELQRPVLDEVIALLATQYGLTNREREIFALLARGYRNKEIQDRLVISGATVHSHVTSIYAKMDLHSRDDVTALIKRAREKDDTREENKRIIG